MPEFTCSLPTSDEEAAAALEGARTIAVVGLSPDPERPSYQVAAYLKSQGFQIIPIRPGVAEILGEHAYPSLTAYGRAADIVDIFRQPDAVPGIVEEAVRLDCKVIWMQEGVSNETAARTAAAAGLKVVQNRCLKKVHRALQS